jgi:methylenetetrahydrofolate reductase (NADPH)
MRAPSQFEVLPVGANLAAEVAAVAPVRLTVTCSPRLGVEATIASSVAHTAAGCEVTPHLAARAVRDRAHLDALLAQMRAAGIDAAFVIGGDNPQPAGVYASAGDLLAELADHPLRPTRLGIAAYPEGHPHIPPDVLAQALADKAAVADYMVTQMCFDATRLADWLRATRASGVTLPAVIGVPGVVERRKLLEVSARIGVGDSLRFLRKQHGALQLLAGRASRLADQLLTDLTPTLADPDMRIDGLHLYTFNRLLATCEWERALRTRSSSSRGARRGPRSATAPPAPEPPARSQRRAG